MRIYDAEPVWGARWRQLEQQQPRGSHDREQQRYGIGSDNWNDDDQLYSAHGLRGLDDGDGEQLTCADHGLQQCMRGCHRYTGRCGGRGGMEQQQPAGGIGRITDGPCERSYGGRGNDHLLAGQRLHPNQAYHGQCITCSDLRQCWYLRRCDLRVR